MDVFLLHTPPFDGKGLRERLRGLEDAVEAGYTQYVGVSNFSLPQIKEARQLLAKNELVCVQNALNMINKQWLYDVVPYTEREGMMFMAEMPLARGMLCKNEKIHLLTSDDPWLPSWRVVSPSQFALNWLLCLPSVVAIPKMGSIKHVEENLGALGWKMPSSVWRSLELTPDKCGLNIRNVLDNLRYYSSPDLFKIHSKHYLNPKNLLDYAQRASFSRRNHI